MLTETASLSLIGDREENQDCVGVIERGSSLLAIVADGMGGHHAGSEAAQAAVRILSEAFDEAELPIFDPRGFLRDAVRKAHDQVVELGDGIPVGARPRAPLVVALVQNDKAYWAHVGDSRVYLIRNRKVAERTRDHSHIEVLLQEGLITEDEYREHPLRNYVEYCIGGEPGEPTMSIAGARQLQRGDVIVLCSDGLWSGADDSLISECFPSGFADLELAANLEKLLQHAVEECRPNADNTTAAVIHWLNADESSDQESDET